MNQKIVRKKVFEKYNKVLREIKYVYRYEISTEYLRELLEELI